MQMWVGINSRVIWTTIKHYSFVFEMIVIYHKTIVCPLSLGGYTRDECCHTCFNCSMRYSSLYFPPHVLCSCFFLISSLPTSPHSFWVLFLSCFRSSLVLVFFAYQFSFFSLPLSSLDMLATYSIIQDLIKCDIKKVTLRNEQLLRVRRKAGSVLLRKLQGSIPAVEDEAGNQV